MAVLGIKETGTPSQIISGVWVRRLFLKVAIIHGP